MACLHALHLRLKLDASPSPSYEKALESSLPISGTRQPTAECCAPPQPQHK